MEHRFAFSFTLQYPWLCFILRARNDCCGKNVGEVRFFPFLSFSFFLAFSHDFLLYYLLSILFWCIWCVVSLLLINRPEGRRPDLHPETRRWHASYIAVCEMWVFVVRASRFCIIEFALLSKYFYEKPKKNDGTLYNRTFTRVKWFHKYYCFDN